MLAFASLNSIQANPQHSSDSKEEMKNYLETLLVELISMPEGAFLTLNIRNTDNFVQFAGSRVEALVFDLPTQQLSRKQKKRAYHFFDSLQIQPEEVTLVSYPEGAAAETIQTYNLIFHETKEAASLTAEALANVFEITDSCDIQPEWP